MSQAHRSKMSVAEIKPRLGKTTSPQPQNTGSNASVKQKAAQPRRKKKYRLKHKGRFLVFLALLVFILTALLLLIVLAGSGNREQPTAGKTSPASSAAFAKSLPVALDGYLAKRPRPWNLILVNHKYPLTEEMDIELAKTDSGHYVDARILSDLEAMLSACQEAGNRPSIISAYRGFDEQKLYFTNITAQYLAQGYEQTKAEDAASKSVQRPGESEHHTGLALDIADSRYTDLDEGQLDTATQKWLMDHCWEYGFILRYPENSTDYTGIKFEPWHYRYVGKEEAKRIHEQGKCLEQYLGEEPFTP